MDHDDLLEQIRAKRRQQDTLKDDIRELVNKALDAGIHWEQVADALGVKSRQRVSQIRRGTR
ncbi:DNA binding protein [Mycobacterium phage Estave1]|uniref:DNA binding protein n=1 Tax=Mycobacterium phage Estave1 TaxID=1536603 RepID=A0A088F671_9CAUD|nr:HTH DNA binding protein [Mycobacterium phage Estave1]AIM40413.1 DNA binding protein [Mycobacterium phage Estave1]